MLSDGLFFKDIQHSVDLFSKYTDQPVYYYEFAHLGQYSLTQFFGPSAAVLKGDIISNLFYQLLQVGNTLPFKRG